MTLEISLETRDVVAHFLRIRVIAFVESFKILIKFDDFVY